MAAFLIPLPDNAMGGAARGRRRRSMPLPAVWCQVSRGMPEDQPRPRPDAAGRIAPGMEALADLQGSGRATAGHLEAAFQEAAVAAFRCPQRARRGASAAWHVKRSDFAGKLRRMLILGGELGDWQGRASPGRYGRPTRGRQKSSRLLTSELIFAP